MTPSTPDQAVRDLQISDEFATKQQFDAKISNIASVEYLLNQIPSEPTVVNAQSLLVKCGPSTAKVWIENGSFHVEEQGAA